MLALGAIGALALLATPGGHGGRPGGQPVATQPVRAPRRRPGARARGGHLRARGARPPPRRAGGAHGSGRSRPRGRVGARGGVTVAVAAVLVHHATFGDAVRTALTIRPHGTAVLGLAVGRVVLALAGAVVVARVGGRARTARPVRGPPDRGAVRARVGGTPRARRRPRRRCVRWCRSAPSADHVALGLLLAAAGAVDGGRPAGGAPPARRGGGGAARGRAAARWVRGRPDRPRWCRRLRPRRTPGRGGHGGRRRAAPRPRSRVRSTPLSRGAWVERALAVALPGLLLAHESAFVAVVRRYPEPACAKTAIGVWLAANASPALVWAAVIAGSFGVLATWTGFALVRRSRPARRGLGPAHHRRAHVVRVRRAPGHAAERGAAAHRRRGSPLLPRDRERHRTRAWVPRTPQLAERRDLPCERSLHGPLYPLLLSVSSRFGGTAYIDHKLLSLVIGAGVVLAAMLLAPGGGGPRGGRGDGCARRALPEPVDPRLDHVPRAAGRAAQHARRAGGVPLARHTVAPGGRAARGHHRARSARPW